MAEVRPLPRRLNPEGTRRLTKALGAMMEGGHDLGPRGVQIRSLGLTIGTLVQALRGELEKLDIAMDLDALMVRLERLTALARSYPHPTTDSAPEMEGASAR